jgi:hypothetical protein
VGYVINITENQRMIEIIIKFEVGFLRSNTKYKLRHLELKARFEEIDKSLKLFTAI